jgi:hypothetical protein
LGTKGLSLVFQQRQQQQQQQTMMFSGTTVVKEEEEKKFDSSSCANDSIRSKDEKKKIPPSIQSSFLFRRWFFRWMIVWLLLYIPLLTSWSIYRGFIVLQDISHRYWIPQIALQEFTTHKAKTQLTYYHRICTVDDHTNNQNGILSATDPSEFTIHDDDEQDGVEVVENAVRLMNIHGAVAFPNLLSESTAHPLREFILQHNAISKHLIYVIENESRWSFPILVHQQHPAINKALQEILNHPILVPAIQAIVGNNPAIIELTAITSAYGAKRQFWHQDGTYGWMDGERERERKIGNLRRNDSLTQNTLFLPFFFQTFFVFLLFFFLVTPDGNAAKYARHFVPSYSLFIPLQNTTAQMGATGICPGSHMCAQGCREYCETHGFQISGKHDNWPLGTGALVNQMTTHSGMAHTDPNAPHRVVFIVTFAPRPLVSSSSSSSSFTVETRNIGVSGSYSLHWSQWGHTLQDFQNPMERMAKHPVQRVLQSLGIYKPKQHSQWGWDFITVNSCRIANSDTGYTVEDLEEFVEQGGFTWLPKHLHGTVHEESTGWVDFLMETLQNCIQASRQVYVAMLAVVVSVNLLHVLFGRGENGRGRRPTRIVALLFQNMVIRLLIIHGIVLILIWSVEQHIDNSIWARNIRSKKSFSIPDSLAQTPDLPATLPTPNDVLILEGMQSEYLASFQQVLEVAHPGNKEWNERVAHYSTGYDRWTSQIQKQVCQSLLDELELHHQRILIQNKNSNWAEVTESRKQWFCHKSLLKKSNPWVSKAVQQLDFLLSEARMGYWRDTALHRRFISKQLIVLQDEILHFSRESLPASSATSMIIGNNADHADTWSNSWQGSVMIQQLQNAWLSLPKDTRMPLRRPTRSWSFSIPSFQSNGDHSTPVVLHVREGDIVEATFLDDQRGT